MSTDLNKRAEYLDSLRLKGIADKLTIDEALNIVNIYGTHLEHIGVFRIIFGINIPLSSLPYPVEIIQGALNKMQKYYFEHGHKERVKLLEETEMMLIYYTNDDEALNQVKSIVKDKKSLSAIVKAMQGYQQDQVEKGYLNNGKLWKLNKARKDELLGDS